MLKKSITLALAVMLIMILSCRKEQQVNTLNKKGGNTAALRLAPEELEDVTNDFITQSLSQQWNLGTYEYEDVVLMLEGALNYRTCTPHEYYDEIAIDSAAFQLDIFKQADDHWYVESERVIEFWNTLMQHAAGAPERLQLTNGFNIVADLEVAGVDYETEKINVSVVIWAGLATLSSIQYCEFGSNDYWWSIFSSNATSGCNNNPNSNNSNTLKEITRRINSGACFGVLGSGYFMNVAIHSLLAMDNYGSQFSCVPCSGLNWAWINNSIDCLSPAELECYTSSIQCVVYKLGINLSKNLISINLLQEQSWCSGCYHQWRSLNAFGNLVIYSND